MIRVLAVGVFCAPVFLAAQPIPDQYDNQIREASERYMPSVDWRLLKAQFYQESKLDSSAVNHLGARGLGQFMPKTWIEVSRKLEVEGTPHDAVLAIEAGVYYMATLRKEWSLPRPEADRHSLALASYNAGLGNILKGTEEMRRCCAVRRHHQVLAPGHGSAQ